MDDAQNALKEKSADPTTAKSPVLDEAVLGHVLRGMNDAFRQLLLHEFCNDIKHHLSCMLDATNRNDLKKYEHATHSLKGISGTFGAIGLHKLTAEANTKAKDGDEIQSFAMSSQIENMARIVMDFAEERRHSLAVIHKRRKGV